ncbi:thioredoxin domain-containing protein 11 isoform X2 [Denticeps clupeoides]|uniref:thioredoxin domain-containing protein 11 isoform X2 n=1 Tax=Denticeps clupeoides TaxID=299321 RepID=UPI0010A48769|nr:thioredoxin domain-containing protein 11 isoform X2 [Denticeps clupeoides]
MRLRWWVGVSALVPWLLPAPLGKRPGARRAGENKWEGRRDICNAAPVAGVSPAGGESDGPETRPVLRSHRAELPARPSGQAHLQPSEECGGPASSPGALLLARRAGGGPVPGPAGAGGPAEGRGRGLAGLLLRAVVRSLHRWPRGGAAGGAAARQGGAVCGGELLVESGEVQTEAELLPVPRRPSVLSQVQETTSRLRVSVHHGLCFGPIEYKGPFTAAYVERFIRKVVTPLTYLPSRAVLREFLSYHEPGVVGFFEFNSSPQPPGYTTFLSSALHALKRDFRGAVRFAVVTNKDVAAAISVHEDETVYLHRRFNSSLTFPRQERNFTSQNICSWVFEHSESILHWLSPTGAKSRSLEEELRKGPALLLFIPHNPLGAHHPLLTQIADVAERYHSCSSPSFSHFQGGDGFTLRTPDGSRPLCCNTLMLPGWRSVSRSSQSVCELCLNRSIFGSDAGLGLGVALSASGRCSGVELEAALGPYLRQLSVSGPQQLLSFSAACSNVPDAYSPFTHYSACCRSLQPGAGVPEPRPQESGQQTSKPHALTPSATGVDCSLADSITGLRCRTNKTLRFYLLDSHLHWTFAAGLGALGNGSGQVFATIVNLPDETHYVLNHQEGLKESLEHLIRNFSAPYSLLQRHLVGERDLRPPSSLIQEVTTASFLNVVMDPKTDVLLFYYTKWCGFCTALNHVVVQLARLFEGDGGFTVARVNVGSNDLPWEFMADHVPAVLFFPKHRKHLSVKYSDNAPITLPNLVRFVLKHTDQAGPGPAAGSGAWSLLEAELRQLQGEVRTLQRARERLSQQLATLWRDNRRISLHAHAVESQNAELQRQSQQLEELHRQKNLQLGDAVRRLQELADASESLLTENTLLKVLLTAMKERRAEQEEMPDDDADEMTDDELDGEQKEGKEAAS